MQGTDNRPSLVALMVVTLVVLTAGCGSAPSSVPAASPSGAVVRPTQTLAAPTASATASAAPRDLLLGALVVTVSDRLRVRSEPRVSDDSIKYEPVLPLGTELRVLDGPVTASGFTWYKVAPTTFTKLDGPGYGWIAMAGKDGEPWIARSAIPPSASPRPTPAVGRLTWGKPVPAAGSWVDPSGNRLVHLAQGYVMLPSIGGSDIWFSTDARHWKTAYSAGEDADLVAFQDLDAGDGGFIAVGSNEDETSTGGAVVVTSTDGQHWQRITDLTFKGAGLELVGIGRHGIVAFGSGNGGPSSWSSTNGADWLEATGASAREVAKGVRLIAEHDGNLMALVTVAGKTSDEVLRIESWQSEDGVAWTRIGELPRSKGTRLDYLTYGHGRWLAMGWRSTKGDDAPVAWTSTDGQVWKPGRRPGANATYGLIDVIGYAQGFIAMSSQGPVMDTCGSGPYPAYATLTWTSTDGRTWRKSRTLKGVAIESIVGVNDAIVGVGLRETKNGPKLVEAEATLPASLSMTPYEPSAPPEPVAIRASTGHIGACGP